MSSGSQSMPAVGSAHYARFMAVLTKYLSVRTAITLVNKSLMELGLTPETLAAGDLPEVIEHTMASLRAFVPEAQLPDLTLDLSALGSVRTHSDVIARPKPGAAPAINSPRRR